jgi:cytochrome b involved in lipid metabolism
MGKGGKNYDPLGLVDDQQQNESMTKTSSPIANGNESGKRQYTWNEIRRHSNKRDRWIVIDKRVYDVTRWTKHPGGQMLLNHYAGQDASVRKTK